MQDSTSQKRRIEGHVYLYKNGSSVYWDGRSYTVEHNIIRDGDLFLKLHGYPETVPATRVQVAPTYYSIETAINESN